MSLKAMATCSSPSADPKQRTALMQLSSRLHSCWQKDLNWSLIPDGVRKACHQVGNAISMPATAVLAGLLIIISFSISHSVVEVEGTDWVEPVLVWISICMPTGMGKSSLCKLLRKLVLEAQAQCGLDDPSTSWMLDDQSFEKMGDLMHQNHWKLLGLYDELPMFLSQINIFRGRGVTDSHELAVFLQLYGSDPWIRRTISGEANFAMKHTGLTIGGFTQPSVARNLIENQSNVEKGLCQRFLWILPQPTTVSFEKLEQVDKDFFTAIVGLMSVQWKSDHSIRKWKLPRPCEIFRKKYDSVQEQILQISCMDDLLCGMLSKSRGHILRVAATMHVLFHLETPLGIPETISEAALKAAQEFVEVCNQHVSFLAGRGDIAEAIESLQQLQKGEGLVESHGGLAHRNAAFSLLLPGKVLYFKALNSSSQRKFRDKGNKAGARQGWELLQEHGLGKLKEVKPNRGTDFLIEFHKAPIPDDSDGKIDLTEKLSKFGVSLAQYRNTLQLPNIEETSGSRSKQSHVSGSNSNQVRYSPRLNRNRDKRDDGDDGDDDLHPSSPKSRKNIEKLM